MSRNALLATFYVTCWSFAAPARAAAPNRGTVLCSPTSVTTSASGTLPSITCTLSQYRDPDGGQMGLHLAQNTCGSDVSIAFVAASTSGGTGTISGLVDAAVAGSCSLKIVPSDGAEHMANGASVSVFLPTVTVTAPALVEATVGQPGSAFSVVAKSGGQVVPDVSYECEPVAPTASCPPAGTLDLQAATGQGLLSATSEQVGTHRVRFVAVAGTRRHASAALSLTLKAAPTPPPPPPAGEPPVPSSPSLVKITSTSLDGAYGAGKTVDVSLVFSEPVKVTSTKNFKVLLETGSTDREATYVSGSGTATMRMRYIVIAGDMSADLNAIAVTSLAGTVSTVSGSKPVSLQVPAGFNLADTKNIAIGEVPNAPTPAVSITQPDPAIVTTANQALFPLAGGCNSVGGTVAVRALGQKGSPVQVQCVAGAHALGGLWSASLDLSQAAPGTLTLASVLTTAAGQTSPQVTTTVVKPAPTALLPCVYSGQTIPSGGQATRSMYPSPSVPYGQSCQSETQTATCTNGVLGTFSGSASHASCSPAAPASCTFNGSALAHGQSAQRTRFQAATVAYDETCSSEVQTATCTDGTVTITPNNYGFDECSPAAPDACSFEGQPLAHGQSATRERFLAASVAFGEQCVSETQTGTCTDGVVSVSPDNYSALSCAPAAPLDCTFDGLPLAHGQSTTRERFETASVAYDQQCVSEVQTGTCTNGVVTVSPNNYSVASCAPATPASCTFEGQPLAHGASATRERFETASVAYDQQCSNEIQTGVCTDGSVAISPNNYSNLACAPEAPLDCTYNGSPVAHGQNATRLMYAAATVPAGQTCQEEQQTATCTNGTLSTFSGMYGVELCVVEDAPSLSVLLVGDATDGYINDTEASGATAIASATTSAPSVGFAIVPAATPCSSLVAADFSTSAPKGSDLASLVDASYAVCARAVTTLGSEALARSNDFQLDTEAPVITATSSLLTLTAATPSAHTGVTVSSGASVTWTKISGPGDLVFADPGVAATTVSATSDGTYLSRISALDAAGNASSADIEIYQDASAPMITAVTLDATVAIDSVLGPDDKSAATAIVSQVVASGYAELEYSLADSSASCASATYVATVPNTADAMTEGASYKVCVRASDLANPPAYMSSASFIVRAVEPSVSVTLAGAATDGYINASEASGSSPMVSVTGTDFTELAYAVVSTEVTCDASLNYSSSTAPTAASVSAIEGAYQVCVRALNQGANAVYETSPGFTVDKTAPTPGFTNFPTGTVRITALNGHIQGGAAAYLHTIVTGAAACPVTLASYPPERPLTTWITDNVSGLPDGTIRVCVIVRDFALNYSAPESISFTKDNTAPGTPTGFTATGGTSAISLSWTAPSGATGYMFARKLTSASGSFSPTQGQTYTDGQAVGVWTILQATHSATSYSDSAVTSGNNYVYSLVAYDALRNYSAVVTSASVSLAATITITASAGYQTTSPVITWTGAASFSSYRVRVARSTDCATLVIHDSSGLTATTVTATSNAGTAYLNNSRNYVCVTGTLAAGGTVEATNNAQTSGGSFVLATGTPTVAWSGATPAYANISNKTNFQVGGTCTEGSIALNPVTIVISSTPSGIGGQTTVNCNHTTSTSGSWTANLTFGSMADGSVTLTATATNVAGKAGTVANRVVTVDTVAPGATTFTLPTAATTVWPDARPRVAVTSVASHQYIYSSSKNSDCSSPAYESEATTAYSSFTVPLTGAQTGETWYVCVNVVDPAGNEGPFTAISRVFTPTATWTAMPTSGAPVARKFYGFAGSTTNTSQFHVVGGQNASNTYLNDHYTYNASTDTWVSVTPISSFTARRYPQVVVDTGPTAYTFVFGGENSSSTSLGLNSYYWASNTTATSTKTALASTGAATGRVFAGVAGEGGMLICGGEEHNAGVATLKSDCFQATTTAWNSVPAIPGGVRADMQFIEMRGSGGAYLWGGRTGTATNTYVNTGYVLTGTWNGSWSSMSTTGAPTARKNHTSVMHYGSPSNRLFVWGGQDNSGTVLGNGAVWTASTNTWSPITSVGAPSARMNYTAFLIGDFVLVYGGQSGTAASTALSDAFLYDITVDKWYPLPGAAGALGARFGANAAENRGGSPANTYGIYIWGGTNASGTLLNTGYKLSTPMIQ